MISKLIEFRSKPRIDENVIIEDYVVLGRSNVIGAGAVLHTGTITGDNVRIDGLVTVSKPPLRPAPGNDTCQIGSGSVLGTGTILYRGSSIGERCLLEEYVVIREGVTVGDGSQIGRGVTIEAGCTLGKNCQLLPNACLTSGTVME